MQLLSGLLLVLAVPAALSAADPESPFVKKTYTYTGGEYKDEVFHYRLMKPAKLEEGQKYPLVVFLHGAGERGTDNEKQLLYFPQQMQQAEFREKYPCFLLAPQCREGKRWVEVDWSDPESTPMAEKPGDQLQVVINLIEKTLKEEAVDPSRVYLTGLSMGGYGSWELAARHPEWFAAVAPICGGADEQQAKKLAALPVWAFHGADDRAVQPERTRRMIAAVKEAGGKPKYTEFPNVGHNSWTPAYAESSGLLAWLFAQQKPAAKQP